MTDRKWKLDPYTLRWASRKLRRNAKDYDQTDAAYVSGYRDAGTDLLLEARAIEKRKTKP